MITPDLFKLLEEDSSRVRNICIISDTKESESSFHKLVIVGNISKFVDITKIEPNVRILEIQKAGQAKFDEGHTLTFPSDSTRRKKYSFLLRAKDDEEERELINFFSIPWINDNLQPSMNDERFRLFDGVVCVLDWKTFQLETVLKCHEKLRICGKMKVKCLIFVDFGDYFFSEKTEVDSEEIHESTKKLVRQCNFLYHSGVLESKNIKMESKSTIPEYFSPTKLNVIFGSLQGCWGFSFDHISQMYFGRKNRETYLKYLWEDHYYFVERESGKKEIVNITEADDGHKKGTKAFHVLVMKPVFNLYKICEKRKVNSMKKILSRLGKSDEVIKRLEKQFKVKRRGGSSALRFARIGTYKRIKHLMKEVFPFAETLNESILRNFPTSRIANRFRAGIIIDQKGRYKNSRIFESVYQSSPHGNLYMLIHEVVYGARRECIAFGRIFSGSVFPGKEVFVYRTSINYNDNKRCEKIKGVVVLSGRNYGYLEKEKEFGVGICGIVFEKKSSIFESFKSGLITRPLVVTDFVEEEEEERNEELTRVLDCVSIEHNISTEEMKIRICIDRGGVLDLEFEFLKIFFLYE